MKRNSYFESLSDNLDKLDCLSVECFKAYQLALKYNLSYPIFVQDLRGPLINHCLIFSRAGIAKIGYATSSIKTDDLAFIYEKGFTVVGIAHANEVLPYEEARKMTCHYILIIGKRKTRKIE